MARIEVKDDRQLRPILLFRWFASLVCVAVGVFTLTVPLWENVSGAVGGLYFYYGIAAFLFANALYAWILFGRTAGRIPVGVDYDSARVSVQTRNGRVFSFRWSDGGHAFDVSYSVSGSGAVSPASLNVVPREPILPIPLTLEEAAEFETVATSRGLERSERTEGAGKFQRKVVRFKVSETASTGAALTSSSG